MKYALFLAAVYPLLSQTSILLKSSTNPVIFGQYVTLTAVISPAAATGTVAFVDGTTILGSSAVVNGQSVLTAQMLNSGTWPLKAIYSGDANFSPATPTPIRQTVNTISSSAFSSPVSSKGSIVPSIVADFNGDGKADLAGPTAGNGTAVVGVGVQLGNGDGTFQPAVETFFSDAVSALASVDFNRDGLADLAVLHGGTLAVLLSHGDGAFQLAADNLAQSATAFAVADFDGDGIADLAVTTSSAVGNIGVLLGNGDGTFQTPIVSSIAPINYVGLLAVGDFNGDGIADLAYSGSGIPTGYPYFTGCVGFFFGNGDGTFQPSPAFLTVSPFFAISNFLTGYFNGDGISDLVVQSHENVTSYVYVLSGNGGEGAVVLPDPDHTGAVVVGDFNGDGKTDLVITFDDSVDVFAGNGNGTFKAPVPYADAAGIGYTLAGDFNSMETAQSTWLGPQPAKSQLYWACQILGIQSPSGCRPIRH